MNKMQKEKLLKPLLSIYENIEINILRDIIVRIDNYRDIKGSFKWYTDKLIELGLLEQDSLKEFEKNRKEIKKSLEELLMKVGQINNLDKIEEWYNKGKIEFNSQDVLKNSSINNVIADAIKDSSSIMDLIQTKAIEGVKETYKDILNTAYIEMSSGVYTYTESVRRALKKYSEQGITAAHYESGKTLSIESVVRRDVVTRVNKLNADIIIEQCKALGTNLVYVDQHLGSRTRNEYMKHNYEAHADWQGKKYMIEGSNEKYPNLYEVTGLGEMLGLYGINCYHNMRPTWEWEKIDEPIDEVENAKAYELFQTQRAYERKIRKLKREKEIAKALNDAETSNSIKDKYKVLNAKFDKWLNDNNLTRDYNREYIEKK